MSTDLHIDRLKRALAESSSRIPAAFGPFPLIAGVWLEPLAEEAHAAVAREDYPALRELARAAIDADERAGDARRYSRLAVIVDVAITTSGACWLLRDIPCHPAPLIIAAESAWLLPAVIVAALDTFHMQSLVRAPIDRADAGYVLFLVARAAMLTNRFEEVLRVAHETIGAESFVRFLEAGAQGDNQTLLACAARRFGAFLRICSARRSGEDDHAK